MDVGVIIKAFEDPDERRTFEKGVFEVVHVGKALGERFCKVGHVGMVLAGVATAAFETGEVVELKPGELFYIPEIPHDSWVVGDEPYTSLHFMGAEKYAS